MAQDVYKKLLEVMQQRRGGYAGLDIPEFYALVEALFTPQEAAVNNVMSRKPSTAGEIAAEMGKGAEEIEPILETMADKGLCKTFEDINFIGCAVCATGCPSEAIVMEAKSDFPLPPRDTKELIAAIKESFSKQAR
jgi:Na+-translocating ferredoxin:NAD+ oxidoreductase RNF subunit RnfB